MNARSDINPKNKKGEQNQMPLDIDADEMTESVAMFVSLQHPSSYQFIMEDVHTCS